MLHWSQQCLFLQRVNECTGRCCICCGWGTRDFFESCRWRREDLTVIRPPLYKNTSDLMLHVCLEIRESKLRFCMYLYPSSAERNDHVCLVSALNLLLVNSCSSNQGSLSCALLLSPWFLSSALFHSRWANLNFPAHVNLSKTQRWAHVSLTCLLRQDRKCKKKKKKDKNPSYINMSKVVSHGRCNQNFPKLHQKQTTNAWKQNKVGFSNHLVPIHLRLKVKAAFTEQ